MLRKFLRIFLRAMLGLLVLAVTIFGAPRLFTEQFFQSRRYSTETVPASPVVIVFGAGLTRSGTPSAVLRDRIETAVRLYEQGKAGKILMSGDNRFVDYNEPGAMRDYAIQLGVREADIVLDFAGRRTYDTCYRARHIFGVREAILVTQSFHMPRALFTCNQLGVKSVGVPADVRQYGRRSYTFWNIREIPATTIAVWEVWVSRPLPVLGKPEPMFGVPDSSHETSLHSAMQSPFFTR